MNKEKFEKILRKLSDKWDRFVRIITLRAYFYDLLQTYVVEEIMIASVTVRHIDNRKVVLDNYQTTIVPSKGDYIIVGVYDKRKFYKILDVVHVNGMGAYVLVRDLTEDEKATILI
jgi:hypothetical protein